MDHSTARSLSELTRSATLRRLAAIVAGTVLLTIASRIVVPMVPVPITLQTLAVTLIGALYGWRLGAVTVIAWLAQGAAGLPVFQSGTGGIAPFLGPTAGYLLAFPIVAAFTGWLAQRGWTGQRTGLAFAAMLAGNLLCLAIGGAWLAVMIGAKQAFLHGVAPFIIGGVLKSAVGAGILRLVARPVSREGL
ncbi:biotin transport system substrate-specific component [Amaricoccus macauensis]|uniref:Biotin transporter n=1 Tax=Amaricoccus macauensis TaxID=57001 RepID=A0A840SMD9_9RHOB|nr:biotin transporter BioY [Amaricoccus macauensis]MBB5221900.1 biotin transport system substrate-specific component [Amaricoccus macauensis]